MTTNTTTATTTTSLLGSVIGKKAAMAISGAILLGFVIVHMLGNLQVFLGPEQYNAYAKALHQMPAVVWGARAFLLLMVVVHIVSATSLTITASQARPIAYKQKKPVAASYAARTMRISGPILAVFIVYHLMHFTIGNVHPDFVRDDVYHNFIVGFSNIYVTAFYVLAQLLLGMHLNHGIWSAFQSLGLNQKSTWDCRLRSAARAISVIIVLGNISMPIAVFTKIIQ